jgi:hypothetical protein
MYSIVSQNAFQANGAVNPIAAPAFTPVAGNCLLAFLYYSGSPGGTVTMSDTSGANGAGWIERNGIDNNSFAGNIRMFTLDSAAATNSTITATLQNTVGDPGILIVELSGLTGTPYLAGFVAAQTSPGTGTDAITSGNTATLGGQPAAVIGLAMDTGVGGDQSGSTPAAGTGYTSLPGVFDKNGIKALSARPEHKRVTATTAVAATATGTVGTDSYVSAVIALMEGSPANLSLPSLGPGIYAPVSQGFAQW